MTRTARHRKPTKREGQIDLDRAWLQQFAYIMLAAIYGAFIAWLVMTL